MNDLISRQAAIEALDGNEPVGDPSKMDDDDVVKMWERIRIINIINKLPSVQPIDKDINVSCKDAISRQVAIDHWRSIIDATDEGDRYNMGFDDGLEFCISDLSTMPSAEPERKTGRWIPQDHNRRSGYVTTTVYYYPKCSECGHSGNYDMSYCPNCGAWMGGEQE